MKKIIFSILAICCYCNYGLAQGKMVTQTGSIKGTVRDSVYNYILQAASVTVYNMRDSDLLAVYGLTDNFGKFSFDKLPIGVPLKLVATFLGYQARIKLFKLDHEQSMLDLGILNLDRKNNLLKEVRITIPPVQMNGDTLEFNADAFKLDKNAVAEDLMRKLPGITMWGDGTITVNGHEISGVKVNGKSFFGGDVKVASQNLPKDAIDKIQVYRKERNINNLRDSTSEINIKLKKRKSQGYFGKMSAGFGSDSRFDALGNLSYFNPSTQAAVSAERNNVNKIANDVQTLIRNSTFKGVSASIEYQPDFSSQGITNSDSRGYIFLHDFIPNPDANKNDHLESHYFYKHTSTDLTDYRSKTTLLGGDSLSTINQNNKSLITRTAQSFDVSYNKHKDLNNFFINGSYSNDSGTNSTYETTSSFGSNAGLQSTSDATESNMDHQRSVGVGLQFFHSKDPFVENRLPADLALSYDLQLNSGDNDRDIKTKFSSRDSTQNKYFDRLYYLKNDEIKHAFSFSLGNLYKLFLKPSSQPPPLSITVANRFATTFHKENDLVFDRSATGVTNTNSDLTVKSNFDKLSYYPSLNVNKTIVKELANRYQKNLTFDLSIQELLFYQNNTSTQSLQNLTQRYLRFIPNGGINFTNNQYGLYEDKYNLGLTVNADMPSLEQLVPLVDSTNIYFIQKPNPHLKPSQTIQLSFYMNHYNYRTKNVFNYNIGLRAGLIRNGFSDSTITDELGRSTFSVINLNGRRFLNLQSGFNKAFKFIDHQVQLSLRDVLTINKTPTYLNNVYEYSTFTTSRDSLIISYSYKDWLVFGLTQSVNIFSTKQSGFGNNNFSSQTNSSTFSGSASFFKRFMVSSNVTYNHNVTAANNAKNFTILNAFITCRFTSGSNVEAKLSALDLLHQNVSDLNYGLNNTLTHETSNVLKRYFMVSLSYYPRKFGMNAKKPGM